MREILVPIDFEDASLRTFRTAADLAHRFGARLTLLHALERDGWGLLSWGAPSARARAVDRLRDLQRTASEEGLSAAVAVRSGSPAQVILSVVHDIGADLVVMRAERRTAWRRLLRGSVMSRLLREADCALWIVRERGPARGLGAVLAALSLEALSLRRARALEAEGPP
ncbi:MAG: universal stress protein [Planctomycetota bacterium]